jgi:GT2 family glycosyltransferase
MRISAIVPCFNGEQFLSQAIASVHAQTRPVAEVIVVDDNSTDGSAALAERLGALVIRLPKNVGPAEARNTGIRAAQGDLVAFLDADDAWMPHHCERTVGLLERFPSAVVAFGESVPMEGPQTDGRLAATRRYTAVEPFDALTVLLEENVVPQAAAVVRRDAILELGGYSPEFRYCEDYHLWLRLASVGAFVGAGEATLWRRTHAEQASNAVVAMRNGAWRARAAALAALPSTTARFDSGTPCTARRMEPRAPSGVGNRIDAALECSARVSCVRSRSVRGVPAVAPPTLLRLARAATGAANALLAPDVAAVPHPCVPVTLYGARFDGECGQRPRLDARSCRETALRGAARRCSAARRGGR